MTPTPLKQGLFDLIPPYWASYLLMSSNWVGTTEMPGAQELIAFVLVAFSIACATALAEHTLVEAQARAQSLLEDCCDSVRASILVARIRELQAFQVFLLLGACTLSRFLAWGMV
jgi:hypothetical protein